jgi:hypothetical protein
MGVQIKGLDFSDMSGGRCTAFPPHALQGNQCQESINFIHETIGLTKSPGYSGLDPTPLFDKVVTGWFSYRKDSGTDTIIAVSDGKVWSVDLTLKTKTEIGLMAGTGRCYAVNAIGKLWICNGTSFVKVESNLSVYRVQILAPTTGATSAQAGGTLPDGVYGVYLTYARYDSSTGLYLYSLPQSLGNVTLGGGNNTVQVTLTGSSDAQVNRVIVFMTDAGGSVPYFYKEANTPVTTINITSNSARNSLIKLAIESAPNQVLPEVPNGIFLFDDALFVWVAGGKKVYWSMKADVNPFELERFPAENVRGMALSINSIFTNGTDLFFNSISRGITVAYSGDMASVIKKVNAPFWFLDCSVDGGRSSVVIHKGLAFGLTNDGFRFFNGVDFSEDVSFHIKPDIDRVYVNSLSVIPSATIYRRSGKRTEYRFSYNNYNYGAGRCNDQFVFNLDFYFDPNESKKTWEWWENGFDFVTDKNGVFVALQNGDSGSCVITEDGVSDVNCYDRIGVLHTVTANKKQRYFKTRMHVDELDSICVWGPLHILATSGGEITGNVILHDQNDTRYPIGIILASVGTVALPSEASGLEVPLPFDLGPEYPVTPSVVMPFSCRSKAIAIEIQQTDDDSEFMIYKMQLPRINQVKNNLT